jgi:hypothetical protein
MKKAPNPVIIVPNKEAVSLERLEKNHKLFNENDLQELLVNHPELLPINEIRREVGDLVCIGREVPVGNSGILDNLYISTGGYPVIVETKLWRNPQARREVLSQVLDYVKELVEKDYEWLEEQWKSFQISRKQDSISLFQAVYKSSEIEELDELDFMNRVNLALESGDVIALIVGDGIEARLQSLVDHLSRDSSHLRYSLALVELACYRLPRGNEDESLIVFPHIIKNVEYVKRAYVEISMDEELRKHLKVLPKIDDSARQTEIDTKRNDLLEDEYFKQLKQVVNQQQFEKIKSFYNRLIKELSLEPDYKKNVIMKVTHPLDEKTGISIIGLSRSGGFYNSQRIMDQIYNWGFTREMAKEFAQKFWMKLYDLDNGFLREGLLDVAYKQHVSIGKIEDKLDKLFNIIKEAVNELLILFQRLNDEESS